MKHFGLFEGIGGFSLAARWMGWETVGWCEINPFCQTVLKHHFPNAKGYGDITTTDFRPWRGQVDILTGGFPCQPFSTSGRRLGTEDDRHLWPEMLRAICQVQPRFIVGENVSGFLNWNGGLVFEEACTDLENEGFEVQSLSLPALGVNAPHERDRVWIIAAHPERKRQSIKGQSGNAIKHPTQGDWKANWPELLFRGKPLPHLHEHDNGFSQKLDGNTRIEMNKAMGNAVVPQVVYEIYKAIQATID